MYKSYWQLEKRPFENCCDPDFFFPGESHQAAVLKLRYAVENQRGGALLAGPSGVGKTMVLGMLRTSLPDELSPFVHLVFPQMSADQLLRYLADELCGPGDNSTAEGVDKSVRRIERFLSENTRAGRHAVVAVDEAHLLDDGRTFEALRLLLNLEADRRPGLTLLLLGQTAILPRLDRMPQFEERLGVKCLLRALTEQETADYVNHRLKLAGSSETIFEREALVAVHQLTHGIPRRINRLCDLSLLIGYAEERKTIAAAHLESVSRELVTVTPE